MKLEDLSVIEFAIQQIGKNLSELNERMSILEKRYERDTRDQWGMIAELRQLIEKIEKNDELKQISSKSNSTDL